MKAIERTAILDEAARIVPQEPLPEIPPGQFRVILLLDDPALGSPLPSGGTEEGLVALARHAEPMGMISNRDMDRLVYGG